MVAKYSHRPIVALAIIGVGTGFLSGLFGIGGGVILVPLLVSVLGYEHRLASGTSIAAILPTSIVGATSYGLQGNVDWSAALLLIAGVIIGAQIGSILLSRLPTRALRTVFICFLILVAIALWFVVPSRSASIELTVAVGALLVGTGFLTGVLSGLLGVGGGVIIVPVLTFFFGASDLTAKGTSLVMLVPGSISGIVGNIRLGNIDLRSAGIIGIASCCVTPLGTVVAQLITPFAANIALSCMLMYCIIQLLISARKR